LIEKDKGWKTALSKIKKRVCKDIKEGKKTNKNKITILDIKNKPIPEAAPQLSSNFNLGWSLNNVYTPYKWECISGTKYKVTVNVLDTWNFDKSHIWRELQRKGSLTPYIVDIDMGEAGVFEIDCKEEDK
jgi:hypothetical protein